MNWEAMRRNTETLNAHLAAGEFDAVQQMIQSVTDYHEGEAYVAAILAAETAPQTLVDAGLEMFVSTRENRYEKHGYWVHSLSHFTELIWKRRLTGWIQRLNLIAFTGAVELDDDNCSDRLVNDFGKYAGWNDNPADFHLTPELIGWMRWEYAKYAKKRIEAGVFPSEEAFIAWQLEQPENHGSTATINPKFFDRAKQRLAELGSSIDVDAIKRNAVLATIAGIESGEIRVGADSKASFLEKLRAQLDA
jgi:hypothetical protein